MLAPMTTTTLRHVYTGQLAEVHENIGRKVQLVTRAGLILGTYEYASQALADAEELGYLPEDGQL